MTATVPPCLPLSGKHLNIEDAPSRLVGLKAHQLMRMASAGLRIPQGFVLTTEMGRAYRDGDRKTVAAIREEIATWVHWLEGETGRRFGDGRRPLLVSVRSGAAVSMPGMLDTVLNIGLNATTVKGLVRMTGNPRLAWDSYRRFVQQYATVVLKCPDSLFERLAQERRAHDKLGPTDPFDWRGLQNLALRGLEELQVYHDRFIPSDPMSQLYEAVDAVFQSWDSERARHYRALQKLDDGAGTAVTVQAMVFGNAGGLSGSGVGFTRDPSTGERSLYMDFLFDTQGEDIVSGRHVALDTQALIKTAPATYAEIEAAGRKLEAIFGDMEDFEFTIEDGAVYLLQSRSGKRTPWAALRIAVDLVSEGLIDRKTALERLRDYDLDTLARHRLKNDAHTAPLATAVPAGIGVATGEVVTNAERARERAAHGAQVILVREDFSTEDIAGIAAADGILTSRGARTSHAAVVARQMGKVCLVGCQNLKVDPERRFCVLNGRKLDEGAFLALDGDSGNIFEGRMEIFEERPLREIELVSGWREGAA